MAGYYVVDFHRNDHYFYYSRADAVAKMDELNMEGGAKMFDWKDSDGLLGV